MSCSTTCRHHRDSRYPQCRRPSRKRLAARRNLMWASRGFSMASKTTSSIPALLRPRMRSSTICRRCRCHPRHRQEPPMLPAVLRTSMWASRGFFMLDTRNLSARGLQRSRILSSSAPFPPKVAGQRRATRIVAAGQPRFTPWVANSIVSTVPTSTKQHCTTTSASADWPRFGAGSRRRNSPWPRTTSASEGVSSSWRRKNVSS
mmetsp:Transcript_59599/g.172624  ORF Transcript_59599/g.172624 Transcript_59599/m.172624 type:complete len:204 (+) Transcript_59599:96-707(+)